MRINLLLCDWFEGLLPDFVREFPEMFYALFDSVAAEKPDYRVYDVQRCELPTEFHREELYVITGSMSGAYEDKEWILRLKEWVRQADAAEVPLVGVCFGHQLVAEALGGKVEPSPKGWGVGIRASRVVLPGALRYFPSGELRLWYNHNDQVVRLPKGARLISTSDFCPNEAFLKGRHILCFQGHPEYTARYERHVLSIAKDQPAEVIERGYASTARDNALCRECAQWMLDLVEK